MHGVQASVTQAAARFLFTRCFYACVKGTTESLLTLRMRSSAGRGDTAVYSCQRRPPGGGAGAAGGKCVCKSGRPGVPAQHGVHTNTCHELQSQYKVHICSVHQCVLQCMSKGPLACTLLCVYGPLQRGISPLIVAVLESHLEMVQALLKGGANANQAVEVSRASW